MVWYSSDNKFWYWLLKINLWVNLGYYPLVAFALSEPFGNDFWLDIRVVKTVVCKMKGDNFKLANLPTASVLWKEGVKNKEQASFSKSSGKLIFIVSMRRKKIHDKIVWSAKIFIRCSGAVLFVRVSCFFFRFRHILFKISSVLLYWFFIKNVEIFKEKLRGQCSRFSSNWVRKRSEA